MLKLNAGKKGQPLIKVKSAKIKTDKKLNKNINNAISSIIAESEKEEIMKTNIITTLLTVLTVVISAGFFIFKTGFQYSKIESGIANNTESLSKLIKLNENVINEQISSKVAISGIKSRVDINKEQLNILNDRIYNLRKKR